MLGRSSPSFRLLEPADVRAIDHTGRRILEEVGVRIRDGKYLAVLEAAGATVSYDEERVRFRGDWIDEVVGHAPSSFVLYSRDGNNDLELGRGNVHFGNGGRVFYILDMATGGFRRTVLRDVAHTATLVNQLENIEYYVIACQAHDLEAGNYHYNDFFHAFNHTTKHVMGGCESVEGAEQMWRVASFIAGGEEQLRQKPFVTVLTNPISPLTLEINTLNIIDFCAKRGIPVMCSSAPIAGATSPATLAGTLSQMHAEALAGVAVAQVCKPGAKVLYGAVPTSMDLRKMEFTMGSVEMAMMNSCAVQLARSYDLPVRASAGVTEAKRPDIQAGSEKNFSNLLVAMAGADCVHMAAGMMDSGNSISYEQFVIDNEIIGMIRRILAGVRVDEDTLGFDAIRDIGPGGNYVTADHTVDHMMEEFFYPSLSVRCNFDIWEEQGRPDMMSRARDQVRQILDDGREGLLSMHLILGAKKWFPGIQMSSTRVSRQSHAPTRIIACAAFRPAIEYLGLPDRYPELQFSFLPSNLHITPRKLEEQLARQVSISHEKGERVVCLYGDCFPDIGDFCERQGAVKVGGFHCYEMLLGSDRFKQITDEAAGTYFLEQDLIRNFEEYCAVPLELHDEELRRYYFRHYSRLVYIRQPSDPDHLLQRAEELATFLQLPLETEDADYSYLEKRILELV